MSGLRRELDAAVVVSEDDDDSDEGELNVSRPWKVKWDCNGDDDDAAPISRMRLRGSPVTVEDSNYDTDSDWDVDNAELDDDYDSLETPFSVN